MDDFRTSFLKTVLEGTFSKMFMFFFPNLFKAAIGFDTSLIALDFESNSIKISYNYLLYHRTKIKTARIQ